MLRRMPQFDPLTTRIMQLQARLGLEPDGIVGPDTLSKLEALAPAPAPAGSSLQVSRRGLAKLVEFEVSSEENYEKKLVRPTWPGGASGVTIGIGYDLGYNTPTQIGADWQGHLPDEDVDRLVAVAGLKGSAAEAARAKVATVRVPLPAARVVFYTRTLPRYAADTRRAYPGAERLPADAQSAMLSLVFNRGTAMQGDRRREMREIVPLVAARDLTGIAARLRSMKRLWEALPGLIKRREAEAILVESARSAYPPDELVWV